ncbi:hypothetical protein [Pseudomonas sp. AU12215]|uniref:hypothetical protein n=1 Tax=Pseudomonas sp. AU12215 TaxID=1860123 RepID=UPI0007EE3C97|nr:hypothetical protein [Pseudomonas sp. AU12215]OBY60439.1 hypothetical protein A9513_014850 [Pseudomonas sp. AU12215]
MSKFTITITEENDGLSILLDGTGRKDGPAAITALALLHVAKDIVPKATKSAAEKGTCQCDKCKAARAEAQEQAPSTKGKPTIH